MIIKLIDLVNSSAISGEDLVIECDSLTHAQAKLSTMLKLIAADNKIALKPDQGCQDNLSDLNLQLEAEYKRIQILKRQQADNTPYKTFKLEQDTANPGSWTMILQEPFNRKKWRREFITWAKNEGTQTLTVELQAPWHDPKKSLAIDLSRLMSKLQKLPHPVAIRASNLISPKNQNWLDGLYHYQQKRCRNRVITSTTTIKNTTKTPLSQTLTAWLEDKAIEVATEKQFQRQIAAQQHVAAQQQKAVTQKNQQHRQTDHQQQHDSNWQYQGDLINEANLDSLVTDSLPIEEIRKIWYGLVGTHALHVTDSNNRITHVPRKTMEFIIAHREQFSGGILFDKLPPGFAFTVVNKPGTRLTEGLVTEDVEPSLPDSILYLAVKNPKMSATDDPLLPSWFTPPATPDLKNPGTVRQFYPFKNGCSKQKLSAFIAAKDASFQGLYGTNKHTDLHEKRNALEILTETKLSLIDDELIDKLTLFLLEEGVDATQALINSLQAMGKSRRDDLCRQMAQVTRLSVLLYHPVNDCSWPTQQAAFHIINTMPAKEYEWWMRLFPEHINANPDANILDLLNAHQYFMKRIANWQPALELPASCSFCQMHNMKTTYAQIINLLEQADNPQEQMQYLNDLDFNMQGVPLAVRRHGYRFVHCNQQLTAESSFSGCLNKNESESYLLEDDLYSGYEKFEEKSLMQVNYITGNALRSIPYKVISKFVCLAKEGQIRYRAWAQDTNQELYRLIVNLEIHLNMKWHSPKIDYRPVYNEEFIDKIAASGKNVIDYGLSLEQLLTRYIRDYRAFDVYFWRYYGMHPSPYSIDEFKELIRFLTEQFPGRRSDMLKMVALCCIGTENDEDRLKRDLATFKQMCQFYIYPSSGIPKVSPFLAHVLNHLCELSQQQVRPPVSLFVALFKLYISDVQFLNQSSPSFVKVSYDVLENMSDLGIWKVGSQPFFNGLFKAARSLESGAVQLQLFSLTTAENQNQLQQRYLNASEAEVENPFFQGSLPKIACENLSSLLHRVDRHTPHRLTQENVDAIIDYLIQNPKASVLDLENYFKANFPLISLNKSPMPASFVDLIAGVESACNMIKSIFGQIPTGEFTLPAGNFPVDLQKILASDEVKRLMLKVETIEQACKVFVNQPSAEQHFVALQNEVNDLISTCQNLELPFDSFVHTLAWKAARSRIVTTLANNLTQTHLQIIMEPCHVLIDSVSSSPLSTTLKKYAEIITSDKIEGGDFLMHLRQVSTNIRNFSIFLQRLKKWKASDREQMLHLLAEKQIFSSALSANELESWCSVIELLAQCHYDPSLVITALVDEKGLINADALKKLQLLRDLEAASLFSGDEIKQLLKLPNELINYYSEVKIALKATPRASQALLVLLNALVAHPKSLDDSASFLRKLQQGITHNAPLYADFMIELGKNAENVGQQGELILNHCGDQADLLLPVLQGSCWSADISLSEQLNLIDFLKDKISPALLEVYQTAPFPTIAQLKQLTTTNIALWIKEYYCDPHGKRDAIAEQLVDTGVIEFIEKINDLYSPEPESIEHRQPLSQKIQQELENEFRDVLALNRDYRFRGKKALSSMSRKELLTAFNEILKDRTTSTARQEMLALACEVMFRVSGRFPYSSQITSVLLAMRFPGNTILGISTGQGKTITNRLLAVMNYAFHHQTENSPVVITSNLMHLAERDYHEGKAFFDYLGLDCHLVNKSTETDIINVSDQMPVTDKKPIIFTTMEDFGLHLLAIKDHYKLQNFREAQQRVHAVTQCDEGDSVIYDRLSDLNYSIGSNPLQEHPLAFAYRVAYHFIRTELKALTKEFQHREHLRKLFRDALIAHDKPLYQEQLALLTDAAIDDIFDATASASERSLQENIDFKIIQIVRPEDNKTVSQIRLFENHQDDKEGTSVYKGGVQQALLTRLNIEYDLQILCKEMPAFPISNQTDTRQVASVMDVVCSFFSRALFTTGTPGTKPELSQARAYFNVQHAFQIPDKRQGKLAFLPTEFARNKQKSFFGKASFPDAIARHVKANSHEAHLIFRKNIPDAEALYQQLRARFGDDRVQMLHANAINSPEELQEKVKKAQQQGMITIATPYAGRGVHIETKLEKSINNALDQLASKLSVTITFPAESERELVQMQGRTARDGQEGEVKYIYNLDELMHLPLEGKTHDEKLQVLRGYTIEQDRHAYQRRERYFELSRLRTWYTDQLPITAQPLFFDAFERICKETVELNLPAAEVNTYINQSVTQWITKQLQISCDLFNLTPGINVVNRLPSIELPKKETTTLTQHYIERFQPAGDYGKGLEMLKQIKGCNSRSLDSLNEAIKQKVITEMGKDEQGGCVLTSTLQVIKNIYQNTDQHELNEIQPLLIKYALAFSTIKGPTTSAPAVWTALKQMIKAVTEKSLDCENSDNKQLAAVLETLDNMDLSFTCKKNAMRDALQVWQQTTSNEETSLQGHTLIAFIDSLHVEDKQENESELKSVHAQLKAFLQLTKARIQKEHGTERFGKSKADSIQCYLDWLDKKEWRSWNALMTHTVMFGTKELTLDALLAISTRTGKESIFSTVSSEQFANIKQPLITCEQRAHCGEQQLGQLKDEAKSQIERLVSALIQRKSRSNHFWFDATVYNNKVEIMNTMKSQVLLKIDTARSLHDLAAIINLFSLEVINDPQLSQRSGKYFAQLGSVQLVEDVKKMTETMNELIMNPEQAKTSPFQPI